MVSVRPACPAGAGHLPQPVRTDPLLWAALAPAVLGLVNVASVDMELGGLRDGHAWRHALDLGAAVLLAMGVYRCSLAQVERAGVALLLLALALLSAVLIPGLGVTVNGAQRYLALGPFRPSVAGPATLMILIFLAAELARQREGLRREGFRFLRLLAVIGLAAILLAVEPNVRAAAFLLIVALVMIGSAGVRPWKLGAMAGLVALVLIGFALWSPNEAARLMHAGNPWADPFSSGLSMRLLPIPVDWGAWIGVGPGASDWEPFDLELARSDLAFALIARTLGRPGVCAVLALYGVVLWRAFAISRQARRAGNAFAAHLAQGIGRWMGLEVLTHMGVNLSGRPMLGWPLPLMSDGGTGLVVFCVAIALLLRADAQTRQGIAAAPMPEPAAA